MENFGRYCHSHSKVSITERMGLCWFFLCNVRRFYFAYCSWTSICRSCSVFDINDRNSTVVVFQTC